MKALLLELAGDYPRTHSIIRLLDELKSISRGKVEEFIRKHRGDFHSLEDANLTSRYFAKTFEKADGEHFVKTAERVVRFGEKLKRLWERTKMVRNWRVWALKIGRAAREILGEKTKVFVFGSVVRGEAYGASDVDILIFGEGIPGSARERGRILAAILERAGVPLIHPFKLHLADRLEAEAYLRRVGLTVEV